MTPPTERDRVAFWTMLLGCLALLYLPNLLSAGMHVDGVLYATVARNMADGVGSLWSPHYTQTLFTEFYEQPPLWLAFEAGMFRILGPSMWTERVLSLMVLIATLLSMVWLWRKLVEPNRQLQSLAWLPIIMFVFGPVTAFVYCNNFLEPPMGLMLLWAVSLLVQNTRTGESWRLVLAGVLVAVAFLIKGVFALFLLPFFVLVRLAFPTFATRRMLVATAVFALSTAACLGVLCLADEPANSLTRYFSDQVFPSVAGDRVYGQRRVFFVVGILLLCLIWPAIVGGSLLLAAKRRNRLAPTCAPQRGWAWVFLGLGLAGSLPIAVSAKQAERYVVPALLFFSFAFSLAIAPSVRKLVEGGWRSQWAPRALRIAAVVLVAGACAATVVRGRGAKSASIEDVYTNVVREIFPDEPDVFKRRIWIEEERLHDVEIIASEVFPDDTLALDESLARAWQLHAYFARFHRVSLELEGEQRYLIGRRGELQSMPGYHLVDVPTKRFSLYRRDE